MNTSQTNFRNILDGKTRISAQMALRLARYFGTTPLYWLILQATAELAVASQDKELSTILKGITRARKTPSSAKAAKKPAPKKPGKKPKKPAAGKKSPPKPLTKAGRRSPKEKI
jgi:plasmid maintenance system antidote protein VapI